MIYASRILKQYLLKIVCSLLAHIANRRSLNSYDCTYICRLCSDANYHIIRKKKQLNFSNKSLMVIVLYKLKIMNLSTQTILLLTSHQNAIDLTAQI